MRGAGVSGPEFPIQAPPDMCLDAVRVLLTTLPNSEMIGYYNIRCDHFFSWVVMNEMTNFVMVK